MGTTATILRLSERPDLTAGFWELADLWPPFMVADPVTDLYYSQLDAWPEHVLVAVDGDDRVLARALGVPFRMGPDVGREVLPANGWDGVVCWAWLDQLAGREPTHVSALEVTLVPEARGTALATRMVEALRQTARARAATGFVAPVRPSRKDAEPYEPMESYVTRTRPDGLPEDPWLRVHARVGGRIAGVCPNSMTVAGTLAQWRDWTGLPFDRSGDVAVPGALVPVHVDVTHDHVVYVEPNVWVVHEL